MSEEKLTVAELLARAQKEHPSDTAAAPRRRRRRSLEEGGISVSDLTGGIPRVKADGPRRGAHALGTEAEDIDEQLAQNGTTAQASEEMSEAEVVETPADVTEVEEGQVELSEPVDEAQFEDVVEAAAPTEQPQVSEEPQAVDEAAAPAATAEPEPPAAKPVLPVAVPLAPRPVMVNEERREITYTFTELRDMETQSRIVAEPGPVARDVLTGSLSYDDRPTASLPVIAEEEAAEAAASESADAVEAPTAVQPAVVAAGAASHSEPEHEPFSAADSEVPETAATGVADFGSIPVEDSTEVEDTANVEQDAQEQVSAEEDLATQVDSEGESGIESEPEFEAKTAAEVAEEAEPAEPAEQHSAVATSNEDTDYREDNSLSVALLIIQVFVGLMLGILVFICFAIAWTRLPFIVAAVMALVVTGGFTLIANYVRRKRDVATPILAAIVGLAITFGPWLMVNL